MDTQYDRIAEEYDALFLGLPYRPNIEAPSVLKLVGPVEGLSVIDLACGTGLYSRKLRQLGAARVVAIDISEGQIAQARSIEAQNPLGIEYLQANVLELPLPEQFDLALAVYLLHYAADTDQLLRMCKQIFAHLKPGGRFVTFQLNPHFSREQGYYDRYGLLINSKPEQPALADGESFTFKVKMGDFISDDLTVQYYSEAALRQALEAAGFTGVRFVRPEVLQSGVEEFGIEHWQPYLDHPHCILIEATKA